MDFEFVAGNAALDFTNTVHSHGEAEPHDDLKSFPHFLAWGRQIGMLRESEVAALRHSTKGVAERNLKRLLDLREVLYQMFSSIAREGKASSDVLKRFDVHVQEAMAAATIVNVEERYELGWKNESPFQRVLYELVQSALDLLTSGNLNRVRQCGGVSCSWLFLDTSRSGRRRWCDMRACGNRAKVRRFRQREA